MKLFVTLSKLAMVSAAMAVPAALPACSTNSGTPCRCPSGSEYAESSTYTVIGAAAKDVTALISDYFNSAWTGAVPYTTSGPDNTVGSTRSYHASTVEGAYNLTEQLTKRSISSDGAYTASFEQLKSTVPIEFHGKNGSFDGYWITYRTRYVFEYETAIISNVYSCATGHPQDFGAFQRSAWSNATSLLTRQGKAPGQSIKPQSIQPWKAGPTACNKWSRMMSGCDEGFFNSAQVFTHQSPISANIFRPFAWLSRRGADIQE